MDIPCVVPQGVGRLKAGPDIPSIFSLEQSRRKNPESVHFRGVVSVLKLTCQFGVTSWNWKVRIVGNCKDNLCGVEGDCQVWKNGMK